MEMNQYGAAARAHWQSKLAGRLAQINDPEAFFTRLGEEAQRQIAQYRETLQDAAPPADGYLEENARLSTAAKTAESHIMRTLIYVDPADQETVRELMRLA